MVTAEKNFTTYPAEEEAGHSAHNTGDIGEQKKRLLSYKEMNEAHNKEAEEIVIERNRKIPECDPPSWFVTSTDKNNNKLISPSAISEINENGETIFKFKKSIEQLESETIEKYKKRSKGIEHLLEHFNSQRRESGDHNSSGATGVAKIIAGLEVGDHMIRWSHIALYPIQIHGIVLEKTESTIMLVDFGLTSTSSSSWFSTSLTGNKKADEDHEKEFAEKEQSHKAVEAAWDKERPTGSRRFNILILTKESDLKKWKKVNYGSSVEGSGTLDKVTSWLNKHKISLSIPSSRSHTLSPDEIDPLFPVKSLSHEIQDWYNMATNNNKIENSQSSDNEDTAKAASNQDGCSIDDSSSHKSNQTQHHANGTNGDQKIPKSDPAQIVLARVYFLLEGDEKQDDTLPKYHVFYSNSECIAVWCKTGRWSTLQAAIFLHSTGIGNMKQMILATSAAAAGAPILIPALLGIGVAYVGAPYLYLKRCNEKWDKYTMQLTEKFWSKCSTKVFVEAITHWSPIVRDPNYDDCNSRANSKVESGVSDLSLSRSGADGTKAKAPEIMSI